MKCLICKNEVASKSLNNIKCNYPCFCLACYWDADHNYEYLEEVLKNHLKGVETMSELKFPTDEDYPDGFNWFAYDRNGHGWFYKEKPSIKDTHWFAGRFNNQQSYDFESGTSVPNWKETLREKPIEQKGVKHDNSKINYLQVFNKDFLPTIEECSVILEQGSQKYSQDNWKSLDPERLKKALLRHLVAYLSDEIEDKESGQKHLSHVITNCLFLNWFDNQKG